MGMSIVETKAYRDDPNGAISDAVKMLEAIEAGKHDTRLRQIVTSFRYVIEERYNKKLAAALWKNERTLIPNPHYETTNTTVDWSRRRSVFSELQAPVVIMPNGIDKFDIFFDEVANSMRIKAQELATNV